MILKNINGAEIKKLIEERAKNNSDEYLVIENRRVTDFYSISCRNIWFKNCFFEPTPVENLFSNSYIENIVIEDCRWWDSIINHAYFKNIMIKGTILENNIAFKDCIIDNLKFKDSLIGTYGFVKCEIKNTDFRGQEYFFLQEERLYFIERYKNKSLKDIMSIINENKDFFVIPWYNIEYTNCIIDLESIRKLSGYSNKIDPSFSIAGISAFRNGYIHLNNCSNEAKVNIIANIFLYNANQIYEYTGTYVDKNRKFLPPLFNDNSQIDLKEYKKTLSLNDKKGSMTIFDDYGNIINNDLIVPIGEILFDSTLATNSSTRIVSNFDASNLNLDSKLSRKLWK